MSGYLAIQLLVTDHRCLTSPEPDHDIANDVDTGLDLITYIALGGPVIKSHTIIWTRSSNTIAPPGSSCQILYHHLGLVVKSHSTLWTQLSNLMSTPGPSCYISYHYLGPVVTSLTIKLAQLFNLISPPGPARQNLYNHLGPSHQITSYTTPWTRP
jgi:hypothetical protein